MAMSCEIKKKDMLRLSLKVNVEIQSFVEILSGQAISKCMLIYLCADDEMTHRDVSLTCPVLLSLSLFSSFPSSRSSYKVNGKNVTQQAALETVKRLNIQVNNLCTFLPQEKVGKFTEMDAQKLLQETMLALSSSNLTEDHQKLIDMQK